MIQQLGTEDNLSFPFYSPSDDVLESYSFDITDLNVFRNFYKTPNLSLSNLSYPKAFVHNLPNSRIFQLKNKQLDIIVDTGCLPEEPAPDYLAVFGDLYSNNFEMGEYYLSKSDSDFYSSIPSKMSFDTVKFCIPVTPSELDIFKRCFAVSHLSVNYTVNQEQKYGFEKFMFITPEEMNSLPSNTKAINFAYNNPTNPLLPGHIVLELSIPKQIYGHNSLMFWSLDTFFKRFRDYLNDCLGFEVIDWQQWILKRVDICYNFKLSNLAHVKDTLSYLSSLRMRNKPSSRGSKGAYPYWATQSNTIKFYSKYDEMKAHKDSFDSSIYDTVLANSENILRFEHEWRSKYFLNKLNVSNTNMITVRKFLDYLIKDYNYNSHLKKVLGEFSMNDKKLSIKDIRSSIKDSFREYNVYLDFIDDIIDNGLDSVKSNLTRTQYYYKVKKLKDIGIDVSTINEHFHERTEIKEPDKDFVNSPLTNLTDEEAMFIDSRLSHSGTVTKLQDFLKQKGARITRFDGSRMSLPVGYQVQIYKE